MHTDCYLFGAKIAQQTLAEKASAQKQAAKPGGFARMMGQAIGDAISPTRAANTVAKTMRAAQPQMPAKQVVRATQQGQAAARAGTSAPKVDVTPAGAAAARPSSTQPAAAPASPLQVVKATSMPQIGQRTKNQAGVVRAINNDVVTVKFDDGRVAQYRVNLRQPTSPATPSAAPPRTPSMPDRVFSAARRYGNATGVAPTSLGGIAGAAINPYLQDASTFADNAFGTNFSGQDANRADWSTRVGQVAFPTRRTYKYVGGKLQEHGPAMLEQARQFIPDLPQQSAAPRPSSGLVPNIMTPFR